MARSVQKPEIVVQKVRAAIARLRLHGESVLVAVSGGGDSMALLHLLARIAAETRIRIGVATIDHGLRKEAKKEVALVERAAMKLGVPFHAAAGVVARGAGIEARARELRYALLEQLRSEHGYTWIATAHTASDQAETLLMRLARGAALGGAAGVLERRGRIVRPMLACTREEVRAYLRKHRIRFAADPMNEDPSFLRVRVRKRVLPELERAAGPGASERLARFAEFAHEDDALLRELAQAALRRARLADGSIDAVALRAMQAPIRRRGIAALLAEAGLAIDADTLERVESALKDSASATLSGDGLLHAEGGAVRIAAAPPRADGGGADSAGARGSRSRTGSRSRATPARPDGRTPPPAPSAPESDVQATAIAAAPALVLDGDDVALPGLGLRLRWSSRAPETFLHTAVLPASVVGPLTIRTRQPGDRVRLPNGRSRKLQDVLVDARVPREERDEMPLVVDGEGEVRWVPGVRAGGSNIQPRSGVTWLSAIALDADQALRGALRYKAEEQQRAAGRGFRK